MPDRPRPVPWQRERHRSGSTTSGARRERGWASGPELTRAWAPFPGGRLSARQACGVSALSVGALILARHRPQVAVAVVDVRALADLALYGLGLAVPPGVATVLGQFRRLRVAHFRLLKLGIFVGKAHHTPLPIAPRRGPTPAAGAPAQGGEERCEQQDLQQGDGAAHGNTRGDLFIQ